MTDAFCNRAAYILLTEYREDALGLAQRRAEGLAERHDWEGAALWRGVVRAIKAMTATEPTGVVH